MTNAHFSLLIFFHKYVIHFQNYWQDKKKMKRQLTASYIKQLLGPWKVVAEESNLFLSKNKIPKCWNIYNCKSKILLCFENILSALACNNWVSYRFIHLLWYNGFLKGHLLLTHALFQVNHQSQVRYYIGHLLISNIMPTIMNFLVQYNLINVDSIIKVTRLKGATILSKDMRMMFSMTIFS